MRLQTKITTQCDFKVRSQRNLKAKWLSEEERGMITFHE